MTETDPHYVAYRMVFERVRALATDPSAATRLDRPVPSCPEWTARQVVAHLAGLSEDWVAGHLDDYGTKSWAGAQVERFTDQNIDTVLSAWERAMDAFGELTHSPRGGTPGMWGFGDAVVHEADIRPVLAPDTRVPAEATALGLKAGVARWREHLKTAEVPALGIADHGGRIRWIGTDADPDAVQVITDDYDLFRAMFGRRSRAQIEAWEWSGNPSPYLDAGLPFPFRWNPEVVED